MILHPNKSQLADLQAVSSVPGDQFHSLAGRFEQLSQAAILSPEQLVDIAEGIFQENAKAQSVIRQLLSLHGFMRRSGCGVDELMETLRASLVPLKSEGGFSLNAWDSVSGAFSALLGTKAIRNAGLAVELRYDYTNLAKHVRILTDIRPLFSTDAGTIEGSVVSFTLRLEYTSDEGSHEISIALDEADVRRLQETCIRALVKSETARRFMAVSNIPTIVSGTESNQR